MGKTSKKFLLTSLSVFLMLCSVLTCAFLINKNQIKNTVAAEPTVSLTVNGIGPWGWNNAGHDFNTSTPEGATWTIIPFSNGTFAASSDNLVATDSDVASMIKLNGVTFGELYKNNSLYAVNTALGFMMYQVPVADLVTATGYDYPTIEIEAGLPIQGEYLPEITIILVNGTWIEKPNYEPTMTAFTEMDAGTLFVLYVDFDTSAFNIPADLTKRNVLASEGFTLNGEEINDIRTIINNRIWFVGDKAKRVANYNDYSHPTFEIAEGATLTDAANNVFTFHATTLYYVDSVWTTEKPNGYLAIKPTTFDSIDSSSTATSLVLKYADKLTWTDDLGDLKGNILLDEKKTLTEDGGSVVIDCANRKITITTVNSYKKVNIAVSKALGNIKIPEIRFVYLDGAWKVNDLGYFNGFKTTHFGLNQNMVDQDAFKKTSINLGLGDVFDQNAFIASASGIYMNGVPLTGGDTKVGNGNVLLIGIGDGIWLQFTPGLSTADYSHLTFHVDTGASITNSTINTNTYYLDEFTLYLDNGQWTTEKPNGYLVVKPTTFDSIDPSSTATSLVLKYTDDADWINDLGTLSSNVLLDGNAFNGMISVNTVNKTITFNLLSSVTKLSINAESICAGVKISKQSFYFHSGAWNLHNLPNVTMTIDGIGPWGWNNADSNFNGAVPVGTTWTLIPFSNGLYSYDATNLITTDSEVASMIKFNGKTFGELYANNKLYAFTTQLGHPMFQIPIADLVAGNGYDCPTVEIEAGLPIQGQYLPRVKTILFDGKWIDGLKWSASAPKIDEYDYAFAIIGDTQIVNHDNSEKFSIIYDWLEDNAESKKIKYVIGLGDITDKDEEAEWNRAKAGFDKLYGIGLDHIQVRGNHDTSASFEAFFSKDTNYTGSIVGSYNGMMANSYKLVSVGDVKYLMLALDYGADDNVLSWADSVVESYSNYNVIVITHGYLDRDGTVIDKEGNLPPSLTGGVNDGIDIWNKFVSKHENITMVLSGHVYCDNIVTSTQEGESGNTVTQFLIDPQQMDKSTPTGMIALFYFSKDGKKLQIQYYSPILGLYEITSPVTTLTLDVLSNLPKTQLNAIGETSQSNNSNYLEVYFTDENSWTDDAGNIADKILLDNVTLSSIGGSVVKGDGKTLKISWTGSYSEFTVLKGAEFANNAFPKIKLYLINGVWTKIYDTNFDGIGSESTQNSLVLKFTDDNTWKNDVADISSKIILDDATTLAQDGGFVSVDVAKKTITVNLVGTYEKISMGEAFVGSVKFTGLTAYCYLDTWHEDRIAIFDGFNVENAAYTLNQNWALSESDHKLKTTIKLSEEAIFDNNAFIGGTRGIYVNGVELLASTTIINDMTVQLVGIQKGLWLWFPDTFTDTANVLGYSHLTLYCSKGATITNSTNGKTHYIDEFTLYLVDGAWTTEKPVDYFVISKTIFSEIDASTTAKRIVLNYTDDATWTDEITALEDAIILGTETTLKEDGGSVSVDKSSKKVIIVINGAYSSLTINENVSCGVSFAKKTIFFNEGWTNKLTLDEVGPWNWNNADHDFNESTPIGTAWTILVFNNRDGFGYSDVNVLETSNDVSLNVKLNGRSFYELYQENNLFAINTKLGYFMFQIPESYLTTDTTYKSPRIEIADGTVFGGHELPQVTIYFSLTKKNWSIYDPDQTVDYQDTSFARIMAGADYNNQEKVLLAYSDKNGKWLDYDDGNLAGKVKVDGAFCDSLVIDHFIGQQFIWIKNIPSGARSITIESGATFAGRNIPGMTLYSSGEFWLTYNPKQNYSKTGTVTFAGVPNLDWDNITSGDYSFTQFKFSAKLGKVSDAFNLASTDLLPLASNMKINGISFRDIYLADVKANGINAQTELAYSTGDVYLYFKLPKSYLKPTTQYPVTTLEIVENTPCIDQVLPKMKVMLFGEHWMAGEGFKVNDDLDFTGIAYGWNNSVTAGVSNNILTFGEYGKDFLGPNNGVTSHSNDMNLVGPNTQIGNTITLNGKPIKDYAGATVSYIHGYNYFYFTVNYVDLTPTDEYPVTTLYIPEGTPFYMTYLPEVTLYLVNGAWTTEEPDVDESIDTVYYTAKDIFDISAGEVASVGHEQEFVSSLSVTGDVVYKFLYKADEIGSMTLFYTHSNDGTDGIYFAFLQEIQEDLNGSFNALKVYAYYQGEEIGSSFVRFTNQDWYTVRIALSFNDNQLQVQLSIERIYLIKTTYDVDLSTLGSKVVVYSENGSSEFSDYKKGDIKAPSITWEGKSSYSFNVGDNKADDYIFLKSLFAVDNVDGQLGIDKFAVIWPSDAFEDGKLQLGEYAVMLTATDVSGNTSYVYVSVIIVDPEMVTVTFDGQNAITVKKGELLSNPGNAVKPDTDYTSFVFDGWYLGDKKWDFENDYLINSIDLTSRFTEVAREFTINIVSEGLKDNFNYKLMFVYGTKVDLSIFAKDGYTFKVYDGDTEVSTVDVTGDANYKLVYSSSGSESGCGSLINVSYILVGLMLVACCYVIVKRVGGKDHE